MNSYFPSQHDGVGGKVSNKGLLANQWMAIEIFKILVSNDVDPEKAERMSPEMTNNILRKLDMSIEPVHQGVVERFKQTGFNLEP